MLCWKRFHKVQGFNYLHLVIIEMWLGHYQALEHPKEHQKRMPLRAIFCKKNFMQFSEKWA